MVCFHLSAVISWGRALPVRDVLISIKAPCQLCLIFLLSQLTPWIPAPLSGELHPWGWPCHSNTQGTWNSLHKASQPWWHLQASLACHLLSPRTQHCSAGKDGCLEERGWKTTPWISPLLPGLSGGCRGTFHWS